MPQIKAMLHLELCNLFNLNVIRHTKEKKAKDIFLSCMYIFLLLILLSYVGMIVYGYISIGLEDIIPAYLVTITSLLIFTFGLFKAKDTIFKKEGYEILCSMPLTNKVILLSRLVRMYIEDLILTLFICLPGFIVYSYFLHPTFSFYIRLLSLCMCIPLIPMVLSCCIGGVITAITSRMKHKSLLSTLLTFLFIGAIFAFSGKLSSIENEINLEMISSFSMMILNLIQQIYPFAIWFSNALRHTNLIEGILFIFSSLGSITILWVLLSHFYPSISVNLYTVHATHDYSMKKLNKSSVLWCLCKKEFKRYFASSIYVTNTLIGPIMGCLCAFSFLFIKKETITSILPINLDLYLLLPILIASIFSMMTTTSVSISMEQNNWWIIKTLPVNTKTILDAKILMNLLLNAPFYILATLFLILALQPDFLTALWIILYPALFILFTAVFGIFVNLHFIRFDYENETSIVKQSASSFIGGMGGLFFSIPLCILVFVIPQAYTTLFKILICILLGYLTLFLYKKNNKTNLNAI